MNLEKFKTEITDEIVACPLVPLFCWTPEPGGSKWTLMSARWEKDEHEDMVLETCVRIVRKWVFATLRADLFYKAEKVMKPVEHPAYSRVVGRGSHQRESADILDRLPLRFDEFPHFISPEVVTESSFARINPRWTNAESELALAAPKQDFDEFLFRAGLKVKAESVSPDGYRCARIEILLPKHFPGGPVKFWEKKIDRLV